ncbi:Retrovirus-related Pol polyprotein from transposon RE1 [Vitis vinifera]|uniref:Retrovirus-related Pol polyprotein from transposon RE1 n=1 Tax=Vitis vinifera TaxID=29760 RepID=A0A438CKY0_VITVI|nr:Retrovirus-related Pol polyprotein from transposon RE1 [Vitis vinifera]
MRVSEIHSSMGPVGAFDNSPLDLTVEKLNDVWDAIREAYPDVENASQIFEIKTRLWQMKQGDREATKYYTKMLGSWQDLDLSCEEEWECTGDSVRFKKKMENERVFEFLVGLNRKIDNLRSRVLSRRPPEGSALLTHGPHAAAGRGPHATVSGPHAARSSRLSPRQSKRTYCEHCKKLGHTKDTCWALHGKPADWKPRQPNKAHSHQASTEIQANKTPTEICQSTSSVGFNSDQLAKLYELFSNFQASGQSSTTLSSGSLAKKEALEIPEWKEAVMEEIRALEKNETWEVINLPRGKKPVGCKWIFTMKYKADGTVERYKARLVAKGFTQTYGIDYTETFAPVAKLNTIRVLCPWQQTSTGHSISLISRIPFLNGELEEEVFMMLPPGFCKEEEETRDAIEEISLWSQTITQSMSNDGRMTILIMYIDDIILTGDDTREVERLKKVLATEFEHAGMQAKRYPYQGKKQDGKPHIAFAVSVVSQYMHSPKESHLEAVYKILRYLKGSPGRGLFFKKSDSKKVEIYTDANWAGSADDRRSTTSYFTFVWGNLVTWRSKKQSVVAKSSAEVEFKAIAQDMCEELWLQKLLEELHITIDLPIKLYCDNKATISISHNPVQHDKTKHIEVDKHFIKEKMRKGLFA